MASELNIPVSDLSATSNLENGGVVHTELMFKGLESVRLAFKLEEKVRSFSPLFADMLSRCVHLSAVV